MKPIEIIEAFDQFLEKRRLVFHAVVIGGAALNLLGVVSRETRDYDILDPKIPIEILRAAEEFSKSQTMLDLKWLNNGPDSLKKNLPKEWEKRLESLFKGKAIIFQTLARQDLLKTKLFAYCDRDTDFNDCIALNPSQKELHEALAWVQFQDANIDWPMHVKKQFQKLAQRLGYGF